MASVTEQAEPAMMSGRPESFELLHCPPARPTETLWRACLADSDFPTHYTTPEYFYEPAFRDKRPFTILSLTGEAVTAVLTGIHDGDCVQSGLSVRPQITFSRQANRSDAMRNLVAGLLQEAGSTKLIDLFLWYDMADMAGSVDARFHKRECEGVVILDLSRGPDALFRRFSSNKKINIKKAIKNGVSVDVANSRDDISAYYDIYVDWAVRKALPVVQQDEFQQTLALTTNRRLFLARHQGRIIAGVVVRFFPGGVMEYSANSSLDSALHLRPNDLLHWRAIEWACAEGLTKYSLGGAHLTLRKFGGEIVPTVRLRLDLSLLRRYVIGDWITDRFENIRSFTPPRVLELGRSLRSRVQRLRFSQ